MTYTADEWRQALTDVSTVTYDDIDAEEQFGPKGLAIARAYTDSFSNDEDRVHATIEALAEQFAEWDVDQFTKGVESFQAVFSDQEEIMKNFLDDNYPGIEPEWLKDDCPLWNQIKRESEVWVEITGTGVFVFGKLS